jgi:hypothetical protein
MFQIAVVAMMALFMIVLGYETIAQALAEGREKNSR